GEERVVKWAKLDCEDMVEQAKADAVTGYSMLCEALDDIAAAPHPAPQPQPTEAHPMLCATHYCKDCAALWRQCDDFTFTLRSQACCTACNNAPVGGQLFALTTPVAMPRP